MPIFIHYFYPCIIPIICTLLEYLLFIHHCIMPIFIHHFYLCIIPIIYPSFIPMYNAYFYPLFVPLYNTHYLYPSIIPIIFPSFLPLYNAYFYPSFLPLYNTHYLCMNLLYFCQGSKMFLSSLLLRINIIFVLHSNFQINFTLLFKQ